MKEKNYNIELIRMLSFLFVIVIHVSNYYSRAFGEISDAEYLYSVVWNAAARVSVPCFFMMTGALVLGKEPDLGKNGRRILRFLTVLIFWSVVYYFFNIYFMGTPVELDKIISTPAEPHLWYLYALIPIYLVLPFLQIMCRGMSEKYDRAFMRLCFLVIVFMYLASFFHEEMYYAVPLLGDRAYAFYFFAGYFIQKYKDRLPGRTPLFAAAAGICIVLEAAVTAGISYMTGGHCERIFEYGCPLVAVSAVSFFIMIYRLQGGKIGFSARAKRRIDWICSHSFGIYLIHILFLDTYKKYVEPTQFSTFAAIPLVTAALLFLSFFCVGVIRKLPGGKYIT